MNLYASTEEIKTYLEITGSSKDAIIAMLNKQATATVNGILSVSDLALHKVTGEIHDGGTRSLALKDYRVRAIGTLIEDEDVEYTQEEDYDIDNYMLFLEDGLAGSERDVLVDYVAGYNASGFMTITIDDYATVAAGMELTVTGLAEEPTVITEGTEWDVGANNNATATALALALDALDGARAFALLNVVYFIDDTPQRATVTIAADDDTGMTLSGGTLNGVNFPEDIRQAIMLLVSNGLARRKNPKMQSYTIGSKTVSFASSSDADEVKSILKRYMRAKVTVL